MTCAPRKRPCVTEPLVFGTIAGATVAWAAGEVTRSRWAWSTGAVLAAVHSAAALAAFHDWSHRAAVASTASQTAAVLGFSWGVGIYFNYLFLLIWTADAAWWLAAPAAYARRSRVLDRIVRGYLYFMFLNGAVVFADGWMRVLGAASVGIVSGSWLIKSFRQTVPAV
jgi:hypothetical protein